MVTVVSEVAFCMNMSSMILACVVLEVARFRHTNHLILSLCLVDPNVAVMVDQALKPNFSCVVSVHQNMTIMVDWALKPNFFSVLFLFTRI